MHTRRALDAKLVAVGPGTRADLARTAVDRNVPPWLVAASTAAAAGVGFLLVDLSLTPLYMNETAAAILDYPGDGSVERRALVHERIRAAFGGGSSLRTIQSGRRQYACTPFLLEASDRDAPAVAIVMERRSRSAIDLAEIARDFRLSPRERETVAHLLRGLTNREVAQRMRVSPNTVKQFVRLIMSKMGVTTRSGIVGKLAGH